MMMQASQSEQKNNGTVATGRTTIATTPTTITPLINGQIERGQTTPTTSRNTKTPNLAATRNNFNNLSRSDTVDSNTKGENEAFGYVIETRSEKLTNGRVYNEFKYLLVTLLGYISKIEMILHA